MTGTRTRVAVAGVTGWTGSAVAAAVAAADDLELVSGVARGSSGRPLDSLVPGARAGMPVRGSVAEALADGVDVLVDYTSAASVGDHVRAAVAAGVHAVVGSSGLTSEDYADIDKSARAAGVGVIGSGNFSVLAALMLRAAEQMATLVPAREILDYGAANKVDVPSGTARDLAERLESAEVLRYPEGELIGPAEARGAVIAGTPIHSLRLPGYSLSTEIVFALSGERLSVRHDAGDGPGPYVGGTLMAVRRVGAIRGVVRGLDRILDLPTG